MGDHTAKQPHTRFKGDHGNRRNIADINPQSTDNENINWFYFTCPILRHDTFVVYLKILFLGSAHIQERVWSYEGQFSDTNPDFPLLLDARTLEALEVICGIFGCIPEVESTWVDVESSKFCRQTTRNNLIILLQPRNKPNVSILDQYISNYHKWLKGRIEVHFISYHVVRM